MAPPFGRSSRRGSRPNSASSRTDRRSGSSFRLRAATVALWSMGALAALAAVWLALVAPVTAPPLTPVRVLVAAGLVCAAVATWWATWDRADRGGDTVGTWFRVLAVAGLLLYLGHAVAALISAGDPVVARVVDGLPLVGFGGFVVAAVALLTAPRAVPAESRRAAVVDGAIGTVALAIVWALLVLPTVPATGGSWPAVVLVAGSAIELVAVAVVLVLAAAARRPAPIAIVPLVLLQLGVLVYAGSDVLVGAVFGTGRPVALALTAVGFVAAAALVGAAALRDAHEPDTAGRLWLRDAWSSVLPLTPIPVAVGVLLFALAFGGRPTPGAALAIAGLVLVVVAAVLWLRLSASAQLRRATVTAATRTFQQATDQPWFVALIQNSRDVVMVVDRRNRLIYASPTLCTHLGVTAADLQGRALAEVVPSLTPDTVRAAQRSSDRPAAPVDVTLTDHAGVDHDVRFHVAPLEGLPVAGHVLTGQDVTDARRLRLLLGESRRRDRVTGLLNAEPFAEAVHEALTWSDPRSLAVVVVDVCDLRELSDTRGAGAGEAVRSAVAGALEQAPGPIIAVGGLRDDAFAALLRDSAPDVAVAACAAHLREALRLVTLPGGDRVGVRLAVGYSVPFSDVEAAGDLVGHADLAASHSLTDPHLPVVRFEHRMREELLREWDQRSAVEAALAAGEYRPFYQPIVALADGRVTGVEALVRRRLPDGSLQPPNEFLPVAQRVGQVARIDAVVRQTALADIARLHRRWPRLGLSLNVAPADVEAGFADQVAAEVRAAGVDPRTVTVEFTESTVARSADAVAMVLAELRGHGMAVALDDFGTGFSSLSRLRDLNVDVLKIDQVFIRDLNSSARAVSLLRAVIEVGLRLGLTTVAEGVASVEQADVLRGMGCERVQGHLFAEALSLSDLMAWLDVRGPGPSVGLRTVAP